MAFLDNSGDIILDAVLTDTGRMRLAKGDGTFKIVKFALGDDEIDYGLFDKNHPSGSAYYDLEIMQTPVLEAFTNNTSILKHKLMSFPRTNLLYLPVIKLNDIERPAAVIDSSNPANVTVTSTTVSDNSGKGIYILPANSTTETKLQDGGSFTDNVGLLGATEMNFVCYQGLDTADVSFKQSVEPGLKETQYIIQMDSRMCYLTTHDRSSQADVSYIDDDLIASYYVTQDTNEGSYVQNLTWDNNAEEQNATQAIMKGPKGTKLMFNVSATSDIRDSNSLFDELGGGSGESILIDSNNYYYIDTSVRVTGATTGHSIDIPVRVMKYYTV